MERSGITTVSHYEVVRPIGRGGMAEVYLARDTTLNRLVALKTFGSDAEDAKARKSVLREARLASAVTHPNVAHVYEAGEENGVAYIAMEYVEGKTLADCISERPLMAGETVDIALQIAEALREAHEQGVIHRDIKPSNIVISTRGHVKVLDFGLAKAVDPKDSIESLSAAGGLIGTIAYMSPEQALGEKLDARTDIFSFGVVLYEMATGRQPFSGTTVAQTFTQILHDAPAPIRQFNATAPPALQQIVSRCLEKRPEHRYQTAAELVADLKTISVDISARIPSGRFAFHRYRRRPALLIAPLILIALIAGAWWLWDRRSPPSAAAVTTLAIMPFAATPAGEQTEYLSDGLTETLINRLSRVPRLRVVSRPTVFAYKGKSYTPQQVRRELNVHGLLSGKIAVKGETIEVQVELIDAERDLQLWGERYRGNVRDIVKIQDRLAGTVMRELDVRLSQPQRQGMASTVTGDPAAYQLYLRGKYLSNQRGGTAVRKSIGYFRAALARDPNFALAQAALAEAYVLLVSSRSIDAVEGYKIARSEAYKALRLDPNSAEVHTVLADIKAYSEWDWEGAEHHFRRAIQLNPHHLPAHHAYSSYLTNIGRFDQALREITIAQSLEPGNPRYIVAAGRTLYYARRYKESEAELRKAIDLEPKSWSAWDNLALTLYAQGRHEEWFEAFKEYQRQKGREDLVPVIEAAWRGGGERAVRRAMLRDSEQSAAAGKAPNLHDWAVASVRLGQYERAFEVLEQLYARRAGELVRLRTSPIWDPLRSDPRYWSLVRRIGLPEPQVSDRSFATPIARVVSR